MRRRVRRRAARRQPGGPAAYEDISWTCSPFLLTKPERGTLAHGRTRENSVRRCLRQARLSKPGCTVGALDADRGTGRVGSTQQGAETNDGVPAPWIGDYFAA